jgi:phage/plasmid-associated DNA primase
VTLVDSSKCSSAASIARMATSASPSRSSDSELNGDTKRWSSYKAREVAEYIRVDARDLWERPAADVLNLQNGLLSLPSRTITLHTPEHLSTVQLPVVYDPQATCPAWDAFLAQVMPEDCQGSLMNSWRC